MKKLTALFLAAAVLLTGCGASGAENPVEDIPAAEAPAQSTDIRNSTEEADATQASEPLSEPPGLEVSCQDAVIVCHSGNYTWSIEQPDGTRCELAACGAAPTVNQNHLPLLEAPTETAVLTWDAAPNSVSVCCWTSAGVQAESPAVTTESLALLSGETVYEITAVWNQGTARYTFRVSAP